MIEGITGEKILVTGGTGFLGGHLIRELVSKGIAPTVVLRKENRKICGSVAGKINSLEYDLFDYDSIEKSLKRLRPDIIIHLAGSVYQTDVLKKLNFDATANLLEVANSIAVKKIIMTGTADEYGFQKCPQVETMPAMPASEYAVSKNQAVNFALALHERYGLPAVILRPFSIYGTGQPNKMFVSQAVESAVKGMPFEMSEGRQKRDMLFVTDFVNAIIKALTVDDAAGKVFNVGSGESVALVDLARKVWKLAGADESLLKIGARQTNDNELHDTEADISKIRKHLGWTPKISLDEGLRIVVEKAKRDWQ